MKTRKTVECSYWSLDFNLNSLSKDGWIIFWMHSPANNLNVQIVCYKE